MSTFVLYGSNGYSGELIARHALARGLEPILAGRNEERIAAQAAALGLPYRIASLTDPDAVDRLLAGAVGVLHCAGPFHSTAAPMVDACLRTGVHYLDISGELAVFEAIAARDQEARQRGVMLLPGVGHDVVATDCLAAHTVARLPAAATRLTLAIQALGPPAVSRGSMSTMLATLTDRGAVRRDGQLVDVPLGWGRRTIDLGTGSTATVTMPLAELTAIHRSTGVPNLEIRIAVPKAAVAALPLLRAFAGRFRSALDRRVRAGAAGPSAEQRAAGRALFWCEVEDHAGGRRVSRLSAPQANDLTTICAVMIVERLLAGQLTPGYATPSSVYGADLVLDVDSVVREDLVWF